jgi:hypothetical protein
MSSRHVGYIGWVLLAPVLMAASGCGGLQPATEALDGQAEIYCLRGLWDIWSLGLDTLAERLRGEGLEAVALSGPDWPVLAESIPHAAPSSLTSRPLVIVGHSYGADDAILLARALGKRGATVSLLILLDATDPKPIPANVDRCLHLYIPTPLSSWAPEIFAGNPVVPEEGNDHTEIINRILTPEEFPDVDHFTIDSADSVHDVVVEEVFALVRGE